MKSDPVKDLNLIGAGTVVEGKIRSQGSMRVDGKLIGDLNVSESVAVGLTGEVEGNISAKNVTVGGKIRGSVNASEKIVFESRSVVRGDVRATKLVIDEGALFDGRISMSERATSEVRH
jgi:cytoskeletal protein CcmA (bactofilin family)